jgi:trigger factor
LKDMQVSLTATGGLERRLEVAVPAAQVATEVEQRLKRLSRTARLKGFRPGKAPYAVVRRQFGEQVHAEVVGDLMRSSFAEAVSKEQLKPAAGPRIEPIALQPGEDLKYAAVFEVLPEVTVKPLESIPVERPLASVTDADVEAMIESMRTQRPVYSEVTRAVRATDRVTVDYDGQLDGKAFEGGVGRDIVFVAGEGRVLGELEAAVTGAAAGDERSFTVQYPPNHQSKELAGRVAQFTVTVKKVEERSLPAVDEEFCRAFGVQEGGIPELRAEVRRSMERELESLIRGRVRTQVLEGLLRDNTLQVPRAMVDEAIERLQLETAQRTGARELSQLPPREQFEEPARRRVVLGMLLAEVARTAELKIDRARVQARLEEIVATYPGPEEARRAYLQNAEAMRQIETAVMEDQVIDYVVSRARVSEHPSSFKEITGFGSKPTSSETLDT